MNSPKNNVRGVSFNGARTYTGTYREYFYRENADKIIGRVLDVGAGGRRTSDMWQDISTGVDEYIGLDMKANNSLDAVGDGRQLPFRSETFDTVILSAVLEHVPVTDCQTLLSEANRVLRPGGRVVVAVAHQYPLHGEPHDYWRPTPHGLEDLMANAGFDSMEFYCGGSYTETLLHTAFYPLRAICLYLGVARMAWAFAFVHYPVQFLSRILGSLLRTVYDENPFAKSWYLMNFAIASAEEQVSN